MNSRMYTSFALSGLALLLFTSCSVVSNNQPVTGKPWTNSLGLPFVPAGTDGVLMCVYDVRVQDFKRFIDSSGHQIPPGLSSNKFGSDPKAPGQYSFYDEPDASWSNPGFSQEGDDPVVGVNWYDAELFCKWLTRTEQAKGWLSANQSYRLPYDQEWSRAVSPSRYAWGNDTWPPPAGAGNFADEAWVESTKPPAETMQFWKIVPGNDGYAHTSPVGHFAANAFGLFDMGGNVRQWCEDWYVDGMNRQSPFPDERNDGGGEKYKVVRGTSWGDSFPLILYSVSRSFRAPDFRRDSMGFRLALVVSPSQALLSDPTPVYPTPVPTPTPSDSPPEGITVSATLSSGQFYVGEPFAVTLTLDNCASAKFYFPDIPSVKQGSREGIITFPIVNGDTQARLLYRKTFTPHQAGWVTFPRTVITLDDGKSFYFHPFTLNILPSTGTPHPVPGSLLDPDLATQPIYQIPPK